MAQLPGGMNENNNTRLGGIHYIVGTVFWPDGGPINVRMRIKLVTIRAGDIITNTDDRGQFVFSNVPPGTYAVVIDREDEFEAVNQPVEIVGRSPLPETYTVTIRLTDRKKNSVKPGVVSASRLAAPKKAVDLYDESLTLSRAGDRKGAIEKLKKAIAEYSEFVDAYNELGVQYMELGELEKADESLKQALKLDSRSFEAMLNLGITLFRQKKFEESESQIRNAISVNGKSAVAYYYLGRALTLSKNFADSEKALKTSLELSSGEMKEAHRMLAKLYIEMGEYKRAIDELEIYLRLVPAAPDKADLNKALAQLRSAVRARPEK